MNSRYLMGIDIGTYESKGVLINSDSEILAASAVPHEMEIPKPGYAEHDAEETWWHDFCRISLELIAKSGVDASGIAAVGCSTIAPCCLPVDGDLRPLRKAILYGVDVRAKKEIAFLEDLYGREKIISRYGTAISSQSAAAKILWVKNNEPDVYAKAKKFVTGTTYLVAKLTGNFAIDRYTAATWVPIYNIEQAGWEEDLSLFCRRDQLADCFWSHETAGYVNESAAKETGLFPGTPVITGTADASAEALSAGVLSPGDLMVMYGSSIFMIHVVDRFIHDPRLWPGPYLFPGTFSLAAGMSTAGTLIRWYRDQFVRDILPGEPGQNIYAEMAGAAAGIPPGSNGLIVLPYFSGERTPINDPLAKGVIFGLNLQHTREHIYNACLEGIGYGIAQHFEIFHELKINTAKVMAVGGGTRHEKWLQIVSDICNRPQQTVNVEIGAAYGDALLAGLGTGIYSSPEDLVAHIRLKNTIIPDEERHRNYRAYYRNYTELYRATKDIMHGMQ